LFKKKRLSRPESRLSRKMGFLTIENASGKPKDKKIV
jgi:hypothetical protein